MSEQGVAENLETTRRRAIAVLDPISTLRRREKMGRANGLKDILWALNRYGGTYGGFRCPTALDWEAKHWLYVIGSGDAVSPVKIGISRDVTHRMGSFNAGNPDRVKLYGKRVTRRVVARYIEIAVHAHFADRAVGREWFNIDAKAALPVVDQKRTDAHAALAHFSRRARAIADELGID